MLQYLDHATRVGVDLNINRFGNGGGRRATCISVTCVSEATKIRASSFLAYNVYVEGFNFLACIRLILTDLRFS
jgi:hypothetical protein